ncbi:MAG: helix-turn-helix domain-containing protein [Bacillaceae bacterium]|nr:helix-turn-helix domain-containing protein [Bacillaceae bacterium]
MSQYIGKVIRDLRVKQNMTQQDLAKGICSVTYLSKIENNNMTPSDEVLECICGRLGITKDELMIDPHESFLKDLETWLKSIAVERDADQADQLYVDIKKQAENVDGHLYQMYFRLYELRYFTFKRNIKEAEHVFHVLKDKEYLFNDMHKYRYYKFLGIFHIQKDLLNLALDFLLKAEDYMKNLMDPELFYLFSITYSRLHNPAKSILYARDALKLYQENINHRRIQECHLLLGINSLLLKDYTAAENHFTKILHSDFEKTNKHLKGRIYHNLGYLKYLNHDIAGAETYLNKALEVKPYELEQLNTLVLLAKIQDMKGNHDQLSSLIDKGLKIADAHHKDRFILKFTVLKLKLKNSKEKLINYLQDEVIPFFADNGEADELKENLMFLADLYYKDRKYKDAAKYFKEACELS